MKIFACRFILICLAGLLACNSSNLKRNQTGVDASKRVSSADISDPILFVENWILINAKDLEATTLDLENATIERVLFDGEIYEAVVTIGDRAKESFLISFKKEDSKWLFLSREKIASDYGWPER